MVDEIRTIPPKLTKTEWNALLDHALIVPASYIIYKVGTEYRAKNGLTGKIDYNGTDAGTIINNAISAISAGQKISLKGALSLNSAIIVDKGLILECYDATLTWTGATTENGMLTTSGIVDGFKLLGGKFLTNTKWVWSLGGPAGSYLNLKNSIIQDVTINHTIRTTNLENVVFRNITQLGQYGDSGFDWGINIFGKNVLVDGFYAPLETEYQGGFSINTTADNIPDNITLRNIYVKGKFGSFIHWYIPKSDSQISIGRTLIENFHVEITGAIQWGHFAIFPFMDAEGSTGTYSGNFGQITARNGKIYGPSVTLVGSVNGIHVLSLCDLEVSGSNGTVHFTADNVRIAGMRGWDATNDYLTSNMQGSLRLNNLNYYGAWNLKLLNAFLTEEICIRDSKIDVGANTLKIESANSGSSKINLHGNFFSVNVNVYETAGHTMVLDYEDNNKSIIVAGGSPQFYKNGGESTWSGTGSQTTHVITHNLVGTPKKYWATASSNDARTGRITGVYADATNITVYYATAPVSGTNNVTESWYAEI